MVLEFNYEPKKIVNKPSEQLSRREWILELPTEDDAKDIVLGDNTLYLGGAKIRVEAVINLT